MILKSMKFNELYKRCFIASDQYIIDYVLKALNAYDYNGDKTCDGIIVYPYLDMVDGLSFEFLALSENGKANLQSYDFCINKGLRIFFGYETFKEYDLKRYKEKDLLQDKINEIDKLYHFNDDLNKLRKIKEIDDLRDNLFPDHIMALLLKDGVEPQQVKVALLTMRDDEIIATLLKKPDDAFDLDVDDVVFIKVVNYGNNVMAVVDLH